MYAIFTAPYADIMALIHRKNKYIRRIFCGEYLSQSPHGSGN